MAKRSRNQRHHAGPPTTGSEGAAADRTGALVTRIRGGDLEGELAELIVAINQRARALSDLQVRQSLARLSVGARVRLTATVSPRTSRASAVRCTRSGDQLVVCLDAPVGRFTSGHIRCSPVNLDLIDGTRT